MFYSFQVLGKKGPLARVWIAAHWDRKLTKQQIFSTDIPSHVDQIANPAAPLALRISGHLLLGVARIYSRKVKYLFDDCTDALTKIKMAFRPAAVDLPADAKTAAYNAITLPENVIDMELDLAELPKNMDELHLPHQMQLEIAVAPDYMPDDFGEGADVPPEIERVRAEGSLSTALRSATPLLLQQGRARASVGTPSGDADVSAPHLPALPDDDMGGFEANISPMHTPPPPAGDELGAFTPVTPATGARVRARVKRVLIDNDIVLSNEVLKRRQTEYAHLVRDVEYFSVVDDLAAIERQGTEQLISMMPIAGFSSSVMRMVATAWSPAKRPSSPSRAASSAKRTSAAAGASGLETAAGAAPEMEFDGGFEFNAPTPPPAHDGALDESSAVESAERAADATRTLMLGDGGAVSGDDVAPTADWSEMTLRMANTLRGEFARVRGNEISFATLTEGVSRKDAARAFFELLVLGSRGYVTAEQPRPFADIAISKADTFDGLFAVRAH